MDRSSRELLVSGGRSMGVELDGAAVDALGTYLEILDKWSKKVNLTGIKGEGERVRKLIVDSLSVAGFLLERGMVDIGIVDLGSGAGIPGIPVKAALPDCGMTLVDSRRKRVFFLEEVVRVLGLSGVRVIRGRSEDLCEGGFGVMTARAVGRLDYLAEEGRRLLAPGGLIIAMKGPDGERELAESGLAEKGLQGEVRNYRLPGKGEPRSLVILEKPASST
jgi:16S rRNA (guanine527-N7)-methyltransferase